MTTDILPRDEFTLDLLATVLARMFEHDRRRQETAEQGNELADPSCSAADDAPTIEPERVGSIHS